MDGAARAYLESLLVRKREAAAGLGPGPHNAALDRWLDDVEEAAKTLAPVEQASAVALDHLLWSSVAAAYPARVLHVGVIVCSDSVDEHGRDFGHMIVDWLSEVCARASTPVTLQLCGRWVAHRGELPLREQWSRCDLVVCSGSSSAAYDSDAWITALGHTLHDIVGCADDVGVRLLGICFGHQLVAQVCGGLVERNRAGVETGLRAIDLTADGVARLGLPALRFVMTHGDTVAHLPPNATRLAHNAFGEQLYAIGQRVLCVQGHPEMSLDYGRRCAVARNGADLADALRSLNDGASDSAAFGSIVLKWSTEI